MQRLALCFTAAAIVLAIALTGCEQPKTAPTPATPSEQAAAPKAETPKCADCIPVTAENFPRAESDLYFNTAVKQSGTTGKFYHYREAMPINNQTVIRSNRDTLYSAAVFDLDAGPVTITLPDSGKRFMSMQIINEDQYTPMVVYGKGNYTLTKDKIGTRYVMAGVRTLVNPVDPQDVQQVRTLQDGIKVTQKSAGTFETPKWDKASQDKVREALLVLAGTMHDFNNAFGSKQQVNPVMYLLGSAAGWGGNPDKDAKYVQMNVPNNDGKQIYKVTVKDVPVDGFWSISVYNAKGYFEKNAQNAYSMNNITAQKSADGSITAQFGGCDGKIPNCIPTAPGWNATIRMYRPHAEILNGRWKFPELQPMS